jgi:hypothetical protein
MFGLRTLECTGSSNRDHDVVQGVEFRPSVYRLAHVIRVTGALNGDQESRVDTFVARDVIMDSKSP